MKNEPERGERYADYCRRMGVAVVDKARAERTWSALRSEWIDSDSVGGEPSSLRGRLLGIAARLDSARKWPNSEEDTSEAVQIILRELREVAKAIAAVENAAERMAIFIETLMALPFAQRPAIPFDIGELLVAYGAPPRAIDGPSEADVTAIRQAETNDLRSGRQP